MSDPSLASLATPATVIVTDAMRENRSVDLNSIARLEGDTAMLRGNGVTARAAAAVAMEVTATREGTAAMGVARELWGLQDRYRHTHTHTHTQTHTHTHTNTDTHTDPHTHLATHIH